MEKSVKHVVIGQHNYVPDLEAEKSHLLPSETVPDQAYTIEELLQRHQRGLLTDLAIGKQPIYTENAQFDDVDLEKLQEADIVDRMEFVEAGREVLDRKRKADKEEEEKRRKAEEEQLIEQRVAERLAKQKEPAKEPEKAGGL